MLAARTLALEWNKRFRLKISRNPAPPLSAFTFLPDRDWNREWETACSLTAAGRGGRDARLTIALGQHFRAFAGAVAGAVLRMNRQRAGVDWRVGVGPLQPLRPPLEDLTADGEEGLHDVVWLGEGKGKIDGVARLNRRPGGVRSVTVVCARQLGVVFVVVDNDEDSYLQRVFCAR